MNLFVYDSAPSSGGVGGGGYHYNAATGGYYYGGASFGSMYGGTTTSTYVIVGENNPEPIKITKNNFKKKMMACFGPDNQILKNYLSYGISGIEAFVNEYNNGK